MAEAVVSGAMTDVSVGGLAPSLQRAPAPTTAVPLKVREAGLEPPVSESKSQEEQYKEAREKAAAAFSKTETAKQLKAAADEAGFVSTVEGRVVSGVAIGEVLAGLIVANVELPIPLPAFPLDFIKPGLKGKIGWS